MLIEKNKNQKSILTPIKKKSPLEIIKESNLSGNKKRSGFIQKKDVLKSKSRIKPSRSLIFNLEEGLDGVYIKQVSLGNNFFLKKFTSFDVIDSSLPLEFKKHALNRKFNKKPFVHGIVIRVKQNNIFCTAQPLQNSLVLHQLSASKCALKITKKSLKFMCKQFLWLFFSKFLKYRFHKFIVIKLIAPAFLRVMIFRFLSKRFHYLKKYFIIEEKKCFNGCRAKKLRRKKRRKFKSFKI